MPTNLMVEADVIDIRADQPCKQDIFLVDTNIWLWQTYAPSIPPRSDVRRKIGAYSQYFRAARVNEATLAYSWLLFLELAHVIESQERYIYDPNISSKDYRHNHLSERQRVTAAVENAWRQVQLMAVPASDLVINEALINAALERFKAQALDGYDLLIVESIAQAGAGEVKILTDDMDYATVPNIQVFTGNPFVLQQAQRQGKLLVR
jgi:hypothetical protein